MDYFSDGSPETIIDETRAGGLLDQLIAALGMPRRVLLLPPDLTRASSGAGPLTVMLYHRLKSTAHVEIMPALGTHVPMSTDGLSALFPGVPHDVFRVHDWRHGVVRLGEVPGGFVRQISDGRADFSILCQINRLLVDGRWDRIISIGQLVPHEVAGIAGHQKNIFVGVGGQDAINKTHFLGAVCGMERAMGRVESPVRKVLDYMSVNFARDLPIIHVLTVRAKDARGRLVTRGLYAGNDNACFLRGAALCRQVNLHLLDTPPTKAVAYLDPVEFKSTWLGNKAIYRLRMAMAEGGELIILGPAVQAFGEDAEIDRLIRKYGYRGTAHTMKAVNENADLAANLAAAAHLIHGSSEGRFRITLCAGGLTRDEIEAVGFEYADVRQMMQQYPPETMRDGFNRLPSGEEVFYVSDPAAGLWAVRSRFDESPTQATREMGARPCRRTS